MAAQALIMMIRYSELEARKRDMERLADPSRDIEGPDDRVERDEAESMREEDGLDTSQRSSVGKRPRSRP